MVRLGLPLLGAAPATAGVLATKAAMAVAATPAPKERAERVVVIGLSLWGVRPDTP